MNALVLSIVSVFVSLVAVVLSAISVIKRFQHHIEYKKRVGADKTHV